MINLARKGRYELLGTNRDTRILMLGSTAYAWIYDPEIGHILVLSRRSRKTNDFALASGEYRLYRVVDEPHIVDLPHLELEVGSDHWQGYLLLTGLPTASKKRSRIIPTDELVGPTAA